MRNPIHAFLRWVLDVFKPGTGKRRATPRPTTAAPVRRPEASRTTTSRLPAHRSPYGLHERLDGAAAAMVRPYVLAAERERQGERARQYRRRVAVVLATDFGIDLDRHVIGAEGVSA
ncbi:hypothetical protein [Streptomyces sp. NPDC002845]